MGGLRNLLTGACCAWPLPMDASCARAARQLYRDAAAEAGIRDELSCDGTMMASELAANTLHAAKALHARPDTACAGRRAAGHGASRTLAVPARQRHDA